MSCLRAFQGPTKSPNFGRGQIKLNWTNSNLGFFGRKGFEDHESTIGFQGEGTYWKSKFSEFLQKKDKEKRDKVTISAQLPARLKLDWSFPTGKARSFFRILNLLKWVLHPSLMCYFQLIATPPPLWCPTWGSPDFLHKFSRTILHASPSPVCMYN